MSPNCVQGSDSIFLPGTKKRKCPQIKNPENLGNVTKCVKYCLEGKVYCLEGKVERAKSGVVDFGGDPPGFVSLHEPSEIYEPSSTLENLYFGGDPPGFFSGRITREVQGP